MLLARLLFLAAMLAFATSPAKAGGAVGEWMTPKGGAKTRIALCGASLCGTLVWLKTPLDPTTGRPQLDVKNPDPALRARPLLGLRFLWGFKPVDATHWAGGRIYDATSGRTFDSKMSLAPGGGLKVEGCVSVFCQAQTWTPAR